MPALLDGIVAHHIPIPGILVLVCIYCSSAWVFSVDYLAAGTTQLNCNI